MQGEQREDNKIKGKDVKEIDIRQTEETNEK